jgi:hypothetical protein
VRERRIETIQDLLNDALEFPCCFLGRPRPPFPVFYGLLGLVVEGTLGEALLVVFRHSPQRVAEVLCLLGKGLQSQFVSRDSSLQHPPPLKSGVVLPQLAGEFAEALAC